MLSRISAIFFLEFVSHDWTFEFASAYYYIFLFMTQSVTQHNSMANDRALLEKSGLWNWRTDGVFFERLIHRLHSVFHIHELMNFLFYVYYYYSTVLAAMDIKTSHVTRTFYVHNLSQLIMKLYVKACMHMMMLLLLPLFYECSLSAKNSVLWTVSALLAKCYCYYY